MNNKNYKNIIDNQVSKTDSEPKLYMNGYRMVSCKEVEIQDVNHLCFSHRKRMGKWTQSVNETADIFHTYQKFKMDATVARFYHWTLNIGKWILAFSMNEQALFNPNCTCICMVPLLFLFGSEI
jgi:hypothetical protein